MSDVERAVSQTAVFLATEKARLHVEEAERLAALALDARDAAQAHRDSADYWLDVALAGARTLGVGT